MERGGISQADILITFATPNYSSHYPLLLETLRQGSGASNVVGCSGMGILTSDGEFEESPALAVLALSSDELSAVPFLFTANPEDPTFIEGEVLQFIRSNQGGSSILVLLSDIFNVHPSRLIQAVHERVGPIPIVGAAASAESTAGRTFQWCNEEITEQGVAGVLFSGPFTASVGVAQGCKPIGEPYIITKAQGNLVEEIASRPALDMLKEALDSLPPDEVQRALGSLFVGIAIDELKYPLTRGDYLVRNITGIDTTSGAIGIAEHVRVGQTVQFNLRDRQSAQDDMEETLKEMAEAVRDQSPSFGLYFNCLGRGLRIYDKPNHDVNAIKSFFGEIPLIGFMGNAEFAPVGKRNWVHNYTGVLALFSPDTRQQEGGGKPTSP